MKIFNGAHFLNLSPEDMEEIRSTCEVFHHSRYQLTIAVPKEIFKQKLGEIQQNGVTEL